MRTPSPAQERQGANYFARHAYVCRQCGAVFMEGAPLGGQPCRFRAVVRLKDGTEEELTQPAGSVVFYNPEEGCPGFRTEPHDLAPLHAFAANPPEWAKE